MKFEKLKKIKTTPSSKISVYIKTPLFHPPPPPPHLLNITPTLHIYINYVLTSLSLSKVVLKNDCLKEYKEPLFRMFLSKDFQSDAAKILKVRLPDSDDTLGTCNRLCPDDKFIKPGASMESRRCKTGQKNIRFHARSRLY